MEKEGSRRGRKRKERNRGGRNRKDRGEEMRKANGKEKETGKEERGKGEMRMERNQITKTPKREGKRKRREKLWKISGARARRWAACMLALALLTLALGGCGKGTDPVGSPGTGSGGTAGSDDGLAQQDAGRYVETQMTLPPQLADWTILQMFSVGDTLHLLAVRQEDNKTVLQEWEQQEDGFVDVTQPWLASMELFSGDWLTVQLMQGGDGTQYLLAGFVAEGEEVYMSHLWKGKGEEKEEITPEKWTVPDEQWGSYEILQGMALLENGTLAGVSYNYVYILSGEDGSVLESEPVSGFYDGSIVTEGENLYLCSSAGGYGMEIEKRKEGRSSESEMIASPTNGTGGMYLSVLKDGTLIAAGGDGIFRRQGGTEDAGWEKLMEGMETEFALSDSGCIGFVALSDSVFYGLFQAEDGEKLNRYEYDPDAVSVVKEVLRLYTVFENALLKQAATMYHKAHPEVLISIESVYPQYYYGETDYNAVYQELNTMLMGKNAPDILVMDHLNMDSYATKGLLENLEDVVRPLEESGELLSGITGSYVQEDGSRYVVPLQFSFCMAIGRDISAENMDSLESLADFLSKADYSYMGSQTVTELVDKFYPYFCSEIVSDKQLDRDAMGKNLEYLKAIADNCGIVDSRSGDEIAYTMWDLAAQAKLAFQEVNGFVNCMFPMTIVDYIKGDYAAFGNRFIPSMQMGICTKSQYTDTAKDFLRFALSEAVQDHEYYNGFPVNRVSMEKQASADRSNFMAATMIMADDGSYIEFDSKAYPKETADRLSALCGALNQPVKEDAKIREVLIECLEGYLNGTQSKEDTVQKIEDGLKMYLAE